MKYYSLKNILKKDAQYNIIFGERSNGKTYAVLKYGLEQYCKAGSQLAIVRRWQDDFTGKRGQTMFDSLVSNREVEKLTRGKWTGVYYYASKWYLCRFEEDKRISDERPFAYGFAITSGEHDKSTSYPHIKTVCFDEFITRSMYLPDEFILFMNTLSTIIRDKSDVKIFMLGNTVNRYCPYFAEMGLQHITKMKQGDIDIYTYGSSDLKVAVEYTAPTRSGKQSDVYFAFDNPKLSMIKTGEWEIDIYPHCPVKYKPMDVVFTYYIVFDKDTLECQIINTGNLTFTFIHRKTTPLKYLDTDIIYTTDYAPEPNIKRNLLKPDANFGQRILWYFKTDKVFYADNEVGEIIRNYLNWCRSN